MTDSSPTAQSSSMLHALWENFLGHSPDWYKFTIIGFLIVNPLIMAIPEWGPWLAAWCLVLEFIFTLAMALKCYPLQPGGLLALEAFIFGMAPTLDIYKEVQTALPVILLLVFMVAGIFFMKELLLFVFTKILLHIRSKVLLAFLFCFVAAFLSAFLDALTVIAVVITVASGFYHVYQSAIVPGGRLDEHIPDIHHEDLEKFRAFLRGHLMHAAVGTALGGVLTTVGEPQNLLISTQTGWQFVEFVIKMAPVTIPVLFVGLITCVVLESWGVCGYGNRIPPNVLKVLTEFDRQEDARRTRRETARLIVQAIAAIFLIVALGLHLAEVGIIGLAVIVIQTAFNGITQEHALGKAFEEALPFTALIVVFLAIVAIIHQHHLFTPVIEAVLAAEPELQPGLFYIANGILSAISDNVFVATVYIYEVREQLDVGTLTRQQFDLLAIAINTGTNIPSILTPNGQAAFLFLLTSSVAPLIRLSYGRMVLMALPYFFTMGIVGWASVMWILPHFV